MTKELNYETALLCAKLSQEVYDFENNSFIFKSYSTIKPQFLDKEKTDTQVALLEDAEAQRGYIVFRGSDDRRDWWTNFNFAQKGYPYGISSSGVTIHVGFSDAYFAARSDIHNIVRQSAIKDWVVTGHSLGGALAKLCAVDLQYNFSPDINIETYIFGSPRVGNKAFADSYNRRVPNTWRFVNGNDLVSGLPRRWQGYRHVDTRFRFNVMFSWRIISGSVKDHYIDRYVAALTKRVSGKE